MLQKKSELEDQGWQKTATQKLVIRKGTVPSNLRDYTTNFFRGIYLFCERNPPGIEIRQKAIKKWGGVSKILAYV